MSATATPPKGRLRAPSRSTARPSVPARRVSVPRRILSTALSFVWILARISIVLACIAVIVAWRGFDVTPISIVSGSMEPTIPTHSLIFVEQVPASKIRTGDVITFDPPGDRPRVTHRVVERKRIGGEWYFRTKGDANGSIDDWRTPNAIEAGTTEIGVTYGANDALRKVWSVPHAGHIVKLTEHTRLRMALVFGSLGAILVLLLVAIWRDEPDAASLEHSTDEKQQAPAR